MLRRSSETARATAVSASDDAVHDSAMPISAPETSSCAAPDGGRHDRHPDHVDDGSGEHRHAQTEAVGDRPDRRLRQTPDDVLDRDRQREIGRRDAQIARDRRQEQPEALPQPHAEAEQHRGSDQNESGLAGRESEDHFLGPAILLRMDQPICPIGPAGRYGHRRSLCLHIRHGARRPRRFARPGPRRPSRAGRRRLNTAGASSAADRAGSLDIPGGGP